MMMVYIALLRGINVGGNKKITMADLRALFEAIGFSEVRSLLQSGNVVFRSEEADEADLARRIEAAIEAQYDFHVDVIMRTAEAFAAAAERNPLTIPDANPSRLMIMFLAGRPPQESIEALLAAHSGTESLQIIGEEAFLYYPDGSGRSRLTNALIERKLGVSGTSRNWNTISKLIALAND